MVERALKMADADGLDALTIRKLAQDLGVTPMALYWHFRSKDDLLEGMAEQVWSEIEVRVDPSVPWWVQLQAGLESLLKVLRAHRSAPQLVQEHEKRNRGGAARHRGCAGDPADARGSTPSMPPRSPAAPCGPGSCWS